MKETQNEIKFDKRNYRRHNDKNKRVIRKSLEELGAGRSVLLDADNSLIAGNGVYEQAQKLGIPVRIIETDGTELVAVKRTDLREDDEKRKRLALADNSASDTSDFDVEMLKTDFSIDELADFGVELPEIEMEETEEQIIERKKKEFEARMAAGEISEEDEDYQEFLQKFELKKTTDDCYTPAVVYDAVADYVAAHYGVLKKDFVRPFYPNGDYQREKYAKDCVVVDNPPFSILAQIIDFYNQHKIKFFLFAPHLTLLATAHRREVCCLCIGTTITYENGANICTSFITNLETDNILRSDGTLYKVVDEANKKNLETMRKSLPKYSYPASLILSPLVSTFSRYNIDYAVPRLEAEFVSELDSQKVVKKAIFGGGYLVSDRLKAEREKAEREKAEQEKAEREKAEREKAEREKAEVWLLSEREKSIIKELNKHQKL